MNNDYNATTREVLDTYLRERRKQRNIDLFLEEFADMTPPDRPNPLSADQTLALLADQQQQIMSLMRHLDDREKQIGTLQAELEEVKSKNFHYQSKQRTDEMTIKQKDSDIQRLEGFFGRVLMGLADLASMTKRLGKNGDPIRDMVDQKAASIYEDAKMANIMMTPKYNDALKLYLEQFKSTNHVLFAESRALTYQYALRAIMTEIQLDNGKSSYTTMDAPMRRMNAVIDTLLTTPEIDALNDQETMSRLKFEDAQSLLLYWQAIIEKLKPLILDGLAALERLQLVTKEQSEIYSQIITVLYRIWNNVDSSEQNTLCPICNSTLAPANELVARPRRRMD